MPTIIAPSTTRTAATREVTERRCALLSLVLSETDVMAISAFPPHGTIDHDLHSALGARGEMASRAPELRVHADEGEAGVAVVIEDERLPVVEVRVATGAILLVVHDELAVMRIDVTGMAFLRRGRELPDPLDSDPIDREGGTSDVALLAERASVRAEEREPGLPLVVELSNPERVRLGAMAGVAVGRLDPILELGAVRAPVAVLAVA